MTRETMIFRRGQRMAGISLSSAEAMVVKSFGPCLPTAAKPMLSLTPGGIRNPRGGLSNIRQLFSGFRVFTKSLGTSKQDDTFTEACVTLSKKNYALLFVMAALLVVGGCKKKETAPPPPPPPPPAAPTASLSANPDSVTPGQPTTLSWRTENANDVSIEGIGKVDPSGSQSVTPQASTTYRLTAKGPGGTQDATARVTVEAAPVQAVSQTDEEMFAANVKDIFFDYDSYAIRGDAQQQIAADATFLKQHPNWRFTIEGHCDERGSTEYNLALGDSRANATRDALVQNGVPAGNIKTISYGKEKPFCNESNEACWQQNRRAHFVLTK